MDIQEHASFLSDYSGKPSKPKQGIIEQLTGKFNIFL